MTHGFFAKLCLWAGLVAMALAVTAAPQPAQAQSSAHCHERAAAYAESLPQPGERAFAGAVIGGLAGAIIGGAIGKRRGIAPGAIIGGSLGTASGLAHGADAAERAYHRAYADCMAERRARPVSAAPAPWSEEWYEYCAAKYRSFDPDTGQFTTYSGRKKLCH